ncbi:hypothetical protein [Aquimarina litoralis]|uniref:hypothetical protein n=1 Tax=Aquimarina litoralis TaxID=584605 RepID=UPI001C561EAE|nr:hypothetical protein [Aquimarina litoralis]MBW1297826.1 hypothetical protein [Aquimarina litoralis]
MKASILKQPLILFLWITSLSSFAQLVNNNEKVDEINFLLNVHSLDASKLLFDKYCGVLDKEEDGETYQYYLNSVNIIEPKLEDNGFVIDILCRDSEKCIVINRRNKHRSKDFIILNEKVARRVYELLKLLQENCE